MSARHGKIKIDGIAKINGKKYIAMSFIQGRLAGWVKKPFFAEFDDHACWIDALKPAFGEKRFFFEKTASRSMETSRFSDGMGTKAPSVRQFNNTPYFLDCLQHGNFQTSLSPDAAPIQLNSER